LWTIVAFYWGAAVYLDLDSDEVDDDLAEMGLTLTEGTIKQCREALIARYPDRWAAALTRGPLA